MEDTAFAFLTLFIIVLYMVLMIKLTGKLMDKWDKDKK